MRILGRTPVAIEEHNLFFLGVAKQRLASSTIVWEFHEGTPVKGKSDQGIIFNIVVVVVKLPIMIKEDPWIKGSGRGFLPMNGCKSTSIGDWMGTGGAVFDTRQRLLASNIIWKFHDGTPVRDKSDQRILFSIMMVIKLPIIKDPWIKGSG